MTRTYIDVYADGASKGNPGKGGWGYVILLGTNDPLTNYGGAPNVTNNQMELQAVIEAMRELNEIADSNPQVRVFTDSTYVQKGISEWIKGWKKNGWKTAAKKPVKNAELWRELDHLQSTLDIDWRWVKGHAGNKYNEMADDLANMGAATV